MNSIKELIVSVIFICVIGCCSFYELGKDDGRHSTKQDMEDMINGVTGYKGTVLQESAMVWRAYVLDYSGSGMTAESATYLLLKKYEIGETDSLTITD